MKSAAHLLIVLLALVGVADSDARAAFRTRHIGPHVEREFAVDFIEGTPVATTHVSSARLEPFVIQSGLETHTLTIGMTDPTVVGLQIHDLALRYNGSYTTPLQLYDDGTHGDQLSGDGVFTINNLSEYTPGGCSHSWNSKFTADLTLSYAGGSSATVTDTVDLFWTCIDPLEVPPVQEYGAGVRGTDHVVGIVATFYGEYPSYTISHSELTQRYYELFPDDRDFIFISTPFNQVGLTSYSAYYSGVKNDVQGIGLSLFDFADDYGGRSLQGKIILTKYADHPQTLNHEITHRWASFLDASLDMSKIGGSDHGHWQQIERSGSGFGPGWYDGVWNTFQPLSGDDYSICFNWPSPYIDMPVLHFSDLELYLMGLVGPGAVSSPIRTLVNPTADSLGEWGDPLHCYFCSASGVRDVSLAEIIAIEGERFPIAADAQRDFRSAHIVAYDRPLTDAELAYFDYWTREFEKPAINVAYAITFEQATGGLATLSTTLTPRNAANAPTITSTPGVTVADCAPYLYDVEATGLPTPTFTLLSGPAVPSPMTIDDVTGEITWPTPVSGNHTVSIEAWNPEGADTQSYTLSVNVPTPNPMDVDPPRETASAPPEDSIQIAFDIPADPLQPWESIASVQGSYSGQIPVTTSFSAVDNTLTIDPLRSFMPGEKVSVACAGGVLSTAGCTSRPFSWTFRTGVDAGSTGGFITAPAEPCGSEPTNIAAGDFNQDGLVDIAVVNYGSQNVTVLLAAGDGSYISAIYPIVGISRSIQCADLDNDGDLDIVTGFANSGYSFWTLLGNGDGSFGSPTGVYPNNWAGQFMTCGDVNADGLPDILDTGAGNEIRIFLNQGSGVFASPQSITDLNYPKGIAVADLDGDWDVDLITTHAQGTDSISVFLNDGAGGFPDWQKFWSNWPDMRDCEVGDVSGDSIPDIVVVHWASLTTVWIGAGDGTFASPQVYASGIGTNYNVVLGDWNGDGALDVACADYGSGRIAVLENNGSGNFAPKGLYSSGLRPVDIVCGDFNGDGTLDIAAANVGSDDVRFLYGDKYVCGCPFQVDFNGDGFIDSVDLNALISALFFNGANPQDSDCPTTRGDFNNDGVIDSTDLNMLIGYLFFNADDPCDPCDPVQGTCAP